MSRSAAAHRDFNMNMKNPQKTNDYSPCEFATKEEIEEAAYRIMLGCVLNGSIRPAELIEQAARENWLAQRVLRRIGERQ